MIELIIFFAIQAVCWIGICVHRSNGVNEELFSINNSDISDNLPKYEEESLPAYKMYPEDVSIQPQNNLPIIIIL